MYRDSDSLTQRCFQMSPDPRVYNAQLTRIVEASHVTINKASFETGGELGVKAQ